MRTVLEEAGGLNTVPPYLHLTQLEKQHQEEKKKRKMQKRRTLYLSPLWAGPGKLAHRQQGEGREGE